jgi:hypothetical protein
MTTFAHATQTTGSSKRVTVGFVGMAIAAVALFGMITVSWIAQTSGAQVPVVAMADTHQSDLQGFLCRIDRRCPTANLATREAPSRAQAPIVATDATHQSDLQNLLCRIDRRCPATNLATDEASRMQIAEMTAR